MSAAAGVLGQYSAAAGAVEFLFTIESVQRNNENLQVTMDRFVRIVRRNASLWGKSQSYEVEFFPIFFQTGRSERAILRMIFAQTPFFRQIFSNISYAGIPAPQIARCPAMTPFGRKILGHARAQALVKRLHAVRAAPRPADPGTPRPGSAGAPSAGLARLPGLHGGDQLHAFRGEGRTVLGCDDAHGGPGGDVRYCQPACR